MPTSPNRLEPDGPRLDRKRLLIDGVAIFLIAFLVQGIPASGLHGQQWKTDECFTVATIVHILKGHEVPVYKLGQSYMFPAEELLSLPLAILTNSVWGFRGAGVFLWSLGVLFLYLSLIREFSRTFSWAICLPMMIVNSSVIKYSGYAIGEYSMAFFLLNLFCFLAISRIDRCDFRTNLMLGVLIGFGIVVFRLLLFPAMAYALIKLGIRANQRRGQLRDNRSLILLAAAQLSAAAAFLSPTFYRYLTRAFSAGFASRVDSQYRPASYEPYLWAISILFVFLAMRTMWKLRHLVSRKDALEFIAFLVPCAAAIVLPSLYFWHQYEQLYALDARPIVWNSQYSLKHWHEWKGNICALFGSVVPHLMLGDNFVSIPDFTPKWNTLATLVLVIAILPIFVQRRRIADKLLSPSVFSICVVSLFLCLLAIVPSWRLYGKHSSRYLILFLPGLLLWLSSSIAFGYQKQRDQVLLFIAIVYAGFSCSQFLLRSDSELTDPSVERIVQRIVHLSKSLDIDLVLIQTQSTTLDLREVQFVTSLQWFLKGQSVTIWHMNDEITNIGYPHPERIPDPQSVLMVAPVQAGHSRRLKDYLSETRFQVEQRMELDSFSLTLLKNHAQN
jgi:hypothetical protein